MPRGARTQPPTRMTWSPHIQWCGSRGTKSFEEILAPIWEGWRQSGMADGEVEELMEQELGEAGNERRRSKGMLRATIARHEPSSTYGVLPGDRAADRSGGEAVHRLRRGRRLALYVSDEIIEEVRDLLGRPRSGRGIRPLPARPWRSRRPGSAGRGEDRPCPRFIYPGPRPRRRALSPISASPLGGLSGSPATTTCSTSCRMPHFTPSSKPGRIGPVTARIVPEARLWEAGIDVLRRFRHTEWNGKMR